MIRVRPTEWKDLPAVMEAYEAACHFMCANGNHAQWVNGYLSEELIRREIADGHSFVCIGEEGDVVGTFCFIPGEDPAYRVIYEGAWLNDEPYALIHRMVIGCIIDILHIRSKLSSTWACNCFKNLLTSDSVLNWLRNSLLNTSSGNT